MVWGKMIVLRLATWSSADFWPMSTLVSLVGHTAVFNVKYDKSGMVKVSTSKRNQRVCARFLDDVLIVGSNSIA